LTFGFLRFFASFSIVAATRSILVSSRFAVTIHSIYSFLLLNESVSKNSACPLFFLNAAMRSSGSFTSFVAGFTQLKISRWAGFARAFFLSAAVFCLKPKTDQVSSKEIRLIQVSLSSSFNKDSHPLSLVRSV
jgi:hypothetical protein